MNLKTKLMEHQKVAINKIIELRVGALFMEMGTGKTRTAIEMIYNRFSKIDKVFYFCPCSVRSTIVKEFEKHCDLKIGIYPENKKVIIIGIETVSMSDSIYLNILDLITEKSFVIVDESILIKNPKSKRSKRLTEISKKCKYKLIMCGTPMSQGIVDLYSQMRFLSSKILGYNSFHSFARLHIGYSEKYPGKIDRFYNEEIIAQKINPYVYQVTKKECLELPKKIYYSEYFSLGGIQASLYLKIKDDLLMEIEYADFKSYTLFKLFTFLQQVTCGIIPKGYVCDGFENLRLDLLQSIMARVLYPEYIQDIEYIKTLYPKASYIYGLMNEKDVEKSLNRYYDNVTETLVATQQSGAYGLNLQGAKTVIFYNNQFSYNIRQQAEDRVYRIGTDKSVNYIDMICRAGWSDAGISKELGMEAEEVVRLKQITGLKEAFADHEFSKSWEEFESKYE